MKITEEELKRRRAEYKKHVKVAGPDDAIYRSGLQISLLPRLHVPVEPEDEEDPEEDPDE